MTSATGTPAFCASCVRAVLVQQGHREELVVPEYSVRCVIAIRQLVLQGLPTTRTRQLVLALSLDRLALSDEDLAVDAEQVGPFHALLARHGTDQQRPVTVPEPLLKIGGLHDLLQQRERAVVQLHDHAPQGIQRGFDFDQVQSDRLVRAEHLPGRRYETGARSRYAGGAGDCDTNGLILHWAKFRLYVRSKVTCVDCGTDF